jgi:hypothetical protein
MQWPSQASAALERWEGEVSQAEAGSSHLEPPTAPKGPYSEQVELMMGGKYDAHSCQCAPQPSNHVKAFVELNSDALSWKLASARSPSCCSKVLAAGIANHMKLHSELLPWSSFAMAQSPGQSPPGDVLAISSPSASSASSASSDLLSTSYLPVPHTALSPHLPPPFTLPASFRPFPLGLKLIDIRAYYYISYFYDVICMYYMYTIDIIYLYIYIHIQVDAAIQLHH